MKLLEGKAVVITGAGRGLGRAYALDAAAHGAFVVVNDIDLPEAEAVAAEIVASGGRALADGHSVAEWDSAAAVVDACVAAFGRLDGLVNNAGIVAAGLPWDMTEAQIRAIVDVNLFGAVFCGTHALRIMAEQGHGSIVISSSSTHMGRPNLGVYGATKGALVTLTHSWAIDTMTTKIRVNAFSPSAQTRISGSSPTGVSAASPPPERNAGVVTYLLSDRAAGITGQVLQLRGEEIVIVAPPALTDHTVTDSAWTAERVADALDPLLRRRAQPVGWWPAGQTPPTPA
jgi:NAD(P)-dependent dehydrogenase (short-subunit alcohol dehydrogenase family)